MNWLWLPCPANPHRSVIACIRNLFIQPLCCHRHHFVSLLGRLNSHRIRFAFCSNIHTYCNIIKIYLYNTQQINTYLPNLPSRSPNHRFVSSLLRCRECAAPFYIPFHSIVTGKCVRKYVCPSMAHTHTRKHIAAEHKKSQEKTKRTHKSVHSYIELKENHIVFYCCCCIIALYSGVWCVARLARCFIRRGRKKSTISAICLELPNRLRAPLRFCCIYISFIAGVLKPCLDILKFYLTIDDIDWILF